MHIKKNVCDNVIYALLNKYAKTKDHLNAWKDLHAMNIHHDLYTNENGQ